MQVQGESLAATKVQSMYRGRLARKKTAPRLQKNFSSISEEDVAATKLQSLFRGSQYRKNMRHSEPSLVQKGRSSLRLVVQSNDPTSNSNAALMNAKQSAETLKNHILSDIAFISDQADTDQMLGEDEEARNFTERCNRKWKAYQQLLWYWIDQRISGFWAAKYILLLFFIVFVSLFSAALLAIALKLDTLFGNNDNEETEFADFGELWWQAWGYTVDGPWHVEYLANNYVEWSRPKVWCFFTVASGCSAFMGILVMSSFLGVMVDLVERAPRGSSSVMEKGHHIILNWSGEIHFLVEQLGYAMESQKGGTIVLLNTRAKTEQVKDLRTVAKGLKRRGINLLVRQGNPRILDDLRRVGVSSAKSVIMLSPNIADALDADVECSNVLLQISSFVDHTQVPIILELRDEESRLLVESAARGRCNPVAAHDMAARILAKAAHTRRLADVYESMLGFEEDEFYFVNMAEMPQLLGKRFGEIIYSLPSAIPIGFSKGGTVTLNPPENAIFAPGSELIVYAEDDSKIVFKPPHESNMPSTDGISPLNTPGILGNGMINNRRVSGLGANNISAGRKRRSGLPGLGVSLPGNAPGMPGPVAAQSERRRTILGDTLVGLEANLQTSPSKKNEPSAFGEDHRLPEAVLVCNWCKNMEEIIVTIDASLKYGSTIILLSQKSLEDRASAFRENGFDPNIDLMNIKIKHYIGEGSLKADLLQLSQPSVVEMNHILVVADECHGNDRMRSDAQNLCILFNVKQVTEEERQSVWMLQQSGIDLTALKKRGRNNPTAVSWEGLKSRFTASKLLNLMAPSPEPSRKNVHIVVEILDSKTRAVVQDDPRLSESCDWITTPNLVAETLSMVAERPETVWILKALLTHESGQHIFVRPASRYVKGGEIVNFWTVSGPFHLLFHFGF